MENLKDLRDEIQAIHPRRGGRRRYPPDLQARIVEFYQQQARKNQSLADVAKALDIATTTLHRFVWKTQKKPAPLAVSLRAVRVKDSPCVGQPDFSARQIVLHMGSEISVSGLDASELVSVLRGLR